MTATTPPAEQNPRPPIIGIVGGVGPLAGIDLQSKIVAQTNATRDQDHVPVLSISWPGVIPDRTEFLLGETTDNPAVAILAQLRLLAAAGATVAAIPCNTAHAPDIFEIVRAGVAALGQPMRLLHLIEETAAHVRAHYPGLGTVGVLSTTGAWRIRLYPALLEPLGLRVIVPDEASQAAVHAAIYDPGYGLKGAGRVTPRARAELGDTIRALGRQGAGAIILGCTELPLAFPERAFAGRPLIDPTLVLARALIRETQPQQLRRWEDS